MFRHHPLLGTQVEVVVTGGDERTARSASETVVAEIDRLEDVFSVFRAGSELNRWKRDEVDRPSRELCEVMVAALDWQLRSGGSFNPLAGLLSRTWADAERNGRPPADDDVARVVEKIFEPRYTISDGRPVRIDDCTALSLNAIAKGYIVDAAAELAAASVPNASVLVSAGGDMRHVGTEPSRVGIENPLRPYDNEPPLTSITLRNAGLATSGGSRRGFRIGDRWVSHALDARTGQPIEAQASISVAAPDAMTADVLATVAGALTPEAAVAMVEAMRDVACFVIDPRGVALADRSWRGLEVH